MRVRVDCLGPSRQWFARDCVELELPGANATVDDVLSRLARDSGSFAAQRSRVAVALGDDVVGPAQTLADGAVLALIPPVSGG